VSVPELSSLMSLGVIVITLVVTGVASLLASRRMSEEEIVERTENLEVAPPERPKE